MDNEKNERLEAVDVTLKKHKKKIETQAMLIAKVT